MQYAITSFQFRVWRIFFKRCREKLFFRNLILGE